MDNQQISNNKNPLTNKNFQQVSIDKLKPYEKNSRKHSENQLEKLKHSVSVFGMIVPIVTDKHGNVLAGHARLEVAKRLGFKTVPIVRVEHLTEHQKRAFIIADNRLAELAEWDEDVLRFELTGLVQAELSCDIDFSIDITGFETAQIDKYTTVSSKEPDELQESDETLEAILNKPPVTQFGELWLLDKHKVLCNDSTIITSYQRLMGSEKARVLCADAPYNVKIDGFVGGNGSTKHREFKQASGEMSFDQFVKFLYLFIYNSCEVIEDGALCYFWIDWRHNQELQKAAEQAGLKQINLAVWDKGAGALGSLYRSRHELVFIYKHGTKSHTNNIMLGKHGRYRTNVWYHPGANRTKEGREALKGHPTPKPVPLIMDIIKDVSKPGDIILDPFLGSGTTVLAATKTNRRCYGIEIDPLYTDLTIRRWQELTGKQAIHAKTGMTFADHEKGLHLVTLQPKVRERHRVK